MEASAVTYKSFGGRGVLVSLHFTLYTYVHTYIHTYSICCKDKNWSNFCPFLKLKTGPIDFLIFYFWKSHSPLQKEEDFWTKKTSKTTTTTKIQFLKLKTGPIMLRNILGPVFNFNLGQLLTLDFLFFWGGGAETPICIVFSAKNAKLKETQKTKKDTICEHTCANCSCQNVRFFFSAFLIFAVLGLSMFFFQRCFW